VALNLNNRAELEQLVQSVYTRGNPAYHQFPDAAAIQATLQGNPYSGNKAPLRDITQGDNWFFDANKAYDQTTGVGGPDVANLLEALKKLE
jgi:hypothetical protein